MFEWPSQAMITEQLASEMLRYLTRLETNRQGKNDYNLSFNFIMYNREQSTQRDIISGQRYSHIMPEGVDKKIRYVNINNSEQANGLKLMATGRYSVRSVGRHVILIQWFWQREKKSS